MFTKIDQLLWKDQKFKSLSDDSKLLFVYLLTCPHRNMLGLYYLPVGYGSEDLNWESERFNKGLTELLGKGFVNYNNTTKIIFIRNFLRYNPIENPNQVKSATKALETIPANGVDADIIKRLESLDKDYLEPLIKQLYKRLDKGLPKQEEVEVEEEVEEEVEVYEEAQEHVDKSPRYDEDHQYYQIALYLRTKILAVNERQKVPSEDPKSMDKWSDTIRKIIELDKRTMDELKEITEFIFKSDFWDTVIQSPGGLRKHWDKIWGQVLRDKKGPKNGYNQFSDEADEWARS